MYHLLMFTNSLCIIFTFFFLPFTHHYLKVLVYHISLSNSAPINVVIFIDTSGQHFSVFILLHLYRFLISFLFSFLNQWWDTRISNKHSIKKISGPHICGESLDIEPNSMQMVVASWRKQKNLQVFDFGSGKEMKSIPEDFTKTMV